MDEFGEKFQKYALDCGELNKQKAGLEKELEKVNEKLDGLKEPDWVEEIVKSILKEMVKRLPGMEYDYRYPHSIFDIFRYCNYHFFLQGNHSNISNKIQLNRKL